jgi:hypothetical protein
VGDFNEIVVDNEKFGIIKMPRKQLKDFQDCIEDCEIFDLGFSGPKYTWSNKRDDSHFTQERLDRAMVNSEWIDLFPNGNVEVLAACNSDHLPLLVSLEEAKQRHKSRNGHFRYEARWGLHKENKDIIKKIWQVKVPSQNAWHWVLNKIDRSKKAMTVWRRKIAKEGDRGITEKVENLMRLQEEEGMSMQREINLHQAEVNAIMEEEELKWKQLAKEHWLKNGDKNTKYFHANVNQKRRSKHINKIFDENGVSCETEMEVEHAFLSYFQQLFSTSFPICIDQCLAGVQPKVSQAMNELLLQQCSIEEVSVAVKQMGGLKALGPDGLTAGFFHDHWSSIWPEVYSIVSNFFTAGRLENEVKYTYIALIPKIANPLKVSDFRPISLCNVFYKIISKTLANRLKCILPDIISTNQSAFILGRLISDNVLVAYDSHHAFSHVEKDRIYGPKTRHEQGL